MFFRRFDSYRMCGSQIIDLLRIFSDRMLAVLDPLGGHDKREVGKTNATRAQDKEFDSRPAPQVQIAAVLA